MTTTEQINQNFAKLEKYGIVKFYAEKMESWEWDWEMLEGDTFNSDVITDIPTDILEKERKTFRTRVYRNGVFGIVGEINTHEGYQHADSVWGFVGKDWQNSGYDSDIKLACIVEVQKLYPELCEWLGIE